jgi:hypothetical protein
MGSTPRLSIVPFASVKPYRLGCFFTVRSGAILRAWAATDADSQKREWFLCSTAKPAARSHQRRASATSASALSATTALQRIRRHVCAPCRPAISSFASSQPADAQLQAVDLNLDRPLGPRVPVTIPEVLRRLLAYLGANREALREYDRSCQSHGKRQRAHHSRTRPQELAAPPPPIGLGWYQVTRSLGTGCTRLGRCVCRDTRSDTQF